MLGGVNQDFRYKELIDKNTLEGKSILEIGCGLGGVLHYIKEKGIRVGSYCGVDIVPEMERINKINYPNEKFMTLDITREKLTCLYDVVIFCGVFNNRTSDGEQFMESLLSSAWKYCKDYMTFNFISTYVSFKDETMEYYDPMSVMKYCIENLSSKVDVKHHYAKCDVVFKVYK